MLWSPLPCVSEQHSSDDFATSASCAMGRLPGHGMSRRRAQKSSEISRELCLREHQHRFQKKYQSPPDAEDDIRQELRREIRAQLSGVSVLAVQQALQKEDLLLLKWLWRFR
uniref:Uncharacterized protein n=1 Tax=Chromera velia CCMP2878 TaxID=1169474 RepID=A0A0G4I0L3_9ALVE|eukprot:Cvel_9942.t1-p1 / transcript=Cvel_9942.t1 / gene=Cvel_9942 / organism=Chromera_velia_CCMP2878 / gene_product=hypothetical protein / transcript_product=hypothetical protein / location=Cvel_scaffold588:49780-50112(-) / protein_length=111 / sequence_SO=supercontig / SO=protein_coding / is_pseudo=false